jgi:CBS domain-containing protein
MDMRVSDILRTKGTKVLTIRADQTVFDAIRELVEKNVGSLLVVDEEGKTAGIITERDILKESSRSFEQLAKTLVREVMTSKLLIGTPNDEIDYVQRLMTEHRIRHLPILSDQRLVGIISIGDVVKILMHEQEVENRDLKDFIAGKYIGD